MATVQRACTGECGGRAPGHALFTHTVFTHTLQESPPGSAPHTFGLLCHTFPNGPQVHRCERPKGGGCGNFVQAASFATDRQTDRYTEPTWKRVEDERRRRKRTEAGLDPHSSRKWQKGHSNHETLQETLPVWLAKNSKHEHPRKIYLASCYSFIHSLKC